MARVAGRCAMDRLTRAIDREISAAVEGATGVERIRCTFAVALPLGPGQITGWRIWVAFLGLAQSSRRLREEHQRRLRGVGLGHLLRPELFPPDRHIEILNGYLATLLKTAPAAG